MAQKAKKKNVMKPYFWSGTVQILPSCKIYISHGADNIGDVYNNMAGRVAPMGLRIAQTAIVLVD